MAKEVGLKGLNLEGRKSREEKTFYYGGWTGGKTRRHFDLAKQGESGCFNFRKSEERSCGKEAGSPRQGGDDAFGDRVKNTAAIVNNEAKRGRK